MSKGRRATALPGGHVVAVDITEAAGHAAKIMAEAKARIAQERLDFESDIESIRKDLMNCAQELGREPTPEEIGEELELRPERILLLAKQCIREGRGSSRLSLYAHPDDAAYLRQQIDQLNPDEAVELQIQSDPDLMQGDLRVETDVGTIDARIGTQLANLAAKIRESFSV